MPISDGVVIGVVLGLVFAAVSYYLYNRMTQLERTVSFMENILLDLKTTTEHTLMSATEPSEEESSEQVKEQQTNNMEISTNVFNGNDDAISVSKSVQSTGNARELSVDQTPRTRVSPQTIHVEREGSSQPSVSVNYEAMTYKELQQVVKQKGVPGTRNLSKAQVIEIIRNFDAGITAASSSSSAASQSTPLSSWNLTSEEGKPIDQLSSGENVGEQLIASFDDKPESSFVSSD